jgi:hypothetical protein
MVALTARPEPVRLGGTRGDLVCGEIGLLIGVLEEHSHLDALSATSRIV